MTDEKEKDLLSAASDWQPDAEGPKNSKAESKVENHGESLDETELKAGNLEGGNDYVSFIDTPFQIRNLEISEAQQSGEELDLDEPREADDSDEDSVEKLKASEAEPEEEEEEEEAETIEASDSVEESAPEQQFEKDDGQLENLAKAIAGQQEALEAQVRASAEDTEEDRAAELARQIAEDQALNEQMAKEAAEAEALAQMDPELLAALPKEPQPDAQGNLDLSELQSCIETLLFMMDRPVSTKRLQELLGPQFKEEIFTQALQGLQERYQGIHHGIELVEVGQAWQLRTKPGRAALAKKLAKIQTQRLSSGGMESLAIIAYRQPVMKEEIDKIRGVDSSYFVRGLLEKKLIEITGRSELPGRPMLYSTSQHFLELFGLKDIASLPPLRELEQMVPTSQSDNPDDEEKDPRVREMRRLVGKMKADTSTTLLYDPKEDEKILTDIRERVKAIPTSTPYLDEQKAAEKAAIEAAKQAKLPQNQPEGTQLGLESTPEAVAAADVQAAEAAGLPPEALDLPPPESLDEPEPSTEQR